MEPSRGFQTMFPYSISSIYVATIGAGFSLNAVVPLFYELAIETAYPIKEGSIAGFLVLVPNFLQSLFLAVPLQSFGTQWMNWTIAITFPLCIVLLLPFAERYPRLERDRDAGGVRV